MRAAAGVVCWVLCVLAGMSQVELYSAAPGERAQAPARWPRGTRLQLDPERPTLLLFVHPRCPCSRATLGELERLIANRAGRLQVTVCFTVPEGLAPEWSETDLWSRARALPAAVVHRDLGGRETSRFGARTSGQALLYAPDGRLLFSGGLTASRGHEGDNLGRSSIEALVGGDPAERASAVYGCPLQSEGDLDRSSTPTAASCCREVPGEPRR